ncbi:helicase HerA domain-containing protein [Anaerococcus octavius]|nr:DUF87 domain-containing protein [Anaerococcus octavius]
MYTRRYIRGLTSSILILMNIFIFFVFREFYRGAYYQYNFHKYLRVIRYNLFLVLSIIILFIIIVRWSLRNKLNNGFKYAITHYLLERKIRRELIDSKFYIKRDNSSIIYLPEIIISFDDVNNLDKGYIKIQNSIKFDKKLEDIRINAAIPGYKVTQQYMSNEGDYYIFTIFSHKNFEQIEFSNEEDYIHWSNEIEDDYSYRLSNNDTLPIHHMGIAAQTGGGKSFLVQSLIIQLKNKKIDHSIYVIDPKSADILSYGKRELGEGFYSDKDGAIELIEKFYNDMKQRQSDMQEFFDNHRNLDYKDNNMPAKILIIDEYGALRASWRLLDKKQRDKIESMLNEIVFMGRQIGFFLVLILQRFTADTVPKEITEQLVTRIVLGDSDDLTYRTLFSPSVNFNKLNLKPGMGYFSYPNIASTDNPSLFVSPFCRFLKGKVTEARSAEVT